MTPAEHHDRVRRPPAAPRPPQAPPPPADYKVPVGAKATPPGKGWQLVGYSWSDKTGLARLSFRRKWNPDEKVLVEVQQPAGDHHEGWRIKPPIDHEAVLARYFESQRMQMQMQAIGAYVERAPR